jgi:hypothetical protein
MAQFPCFLLSLFQFLFCLPSVSLYLLGTLLAVIGSRPPWSQVARKLISPFPYPPHSKIPTPWGFHELNVCLTKTTSQIWLTRSRTVDVVKCRRLPSFDTVSWNYVKRPVSNIVKIFLLAIQRRKVKRRRSLNPAAMRSKSPFY